MGVAPIAWSSYCIATLQGYFAQTCFTMATFADQLAIYRSELCEAQANGHDAVARKLEQKIQELEAFQQRHPEES